VSDGPADRPLLTEMAEKLRQARSAGFGEEIESPSRADAGAPPRAAREPEAPPAPRRPAADSAPETFQGPSRIDSLERRLFELRVALDEAVSRQTDASPDAGAPAPSEAEAWIAFAAAAAGRFDDADVQAGVADRLLAEYRKRRQRGGLLDEGAGER
jgi:hypothetical protein